MLCSKIPLQDFYQQRDVTPPWPVAQTVDLYQVLGTQFHNPRTRLRRRSISQNGENESREITLHRRTLSCNNFNLAVTTLTPMHTISLVRYKENILICAACKAWSCYCIACDRILTWQDARIELRDGPQSTQLIPEDQDRLPQVATPSVTTAMTSLPLPLSTFLFLFPPMKWNDRGCFCFCDVAVVAAGLWGTTGGGRSMMGASPTFLFGSVWKWAKWLVVLMVWATCGTYFACRYFSMI